MKIKVMETQQSKRLDMVLSDLLPQFTRAHIKKMIEEGNVLLDGKKVKAGQSVKLGQEIEYTISQVKELDAKPEQIDFDIVYQDEDLLVVNKPQGLVVHPCSSTKSGTLVNGLVYHIKDLSGINGVLRPGIVHRLDKNTSGLMLVAKNDLAHVSLAEQIKNKRCVRRYLALLEGNLKDEKGEIQTYLSRSKTDRKKMAVSESGKIAISQYKVIKRFTNACLVEFTLKTGRTHQIRVHAKYLNHPVVGDVEYGHAEKGLAGQLLHSYYIAFTHPRNQKQMEFTIPLPRYFEEYINKLKPQAVEF